MLVSHGAGHTHLLKEEKTRNADKTTTTYNKCMLTEGRNAIGMKLRTKIRIEGE